MTTAAEARRAPRSRTRSGSGRVALLARPLTPYYLVIGSALLLVTLGLVMVLSASSVRSYQDSGSSFTVFERQLMWVALGLPAMWVALRLPPKAFRVLAYPALLLAVVGLILVFVPGIGVTRYGATRWLVLGPFTVQPAELAKLALVLWGADLLTRKQKLLRDWKHLLMPLLPVATLIAGLIMLEPDMGTTMTTLAVIFGLLWVVGAPMRIFAALVGAVGLLAGILAVTAPYRLERLTAFVNPFDDPLNTGYQGIQGLYALGSGGWFGVGLGGSRQKWEYLPNAHTDYIFAIVGEELGLFGTLAVLLLFALLAYAGVRIAQSTRDPFIRLAASGVTAWLLVQALVNMGAVTGLLPITGIPLPLVSFGGSSLVVSLFAIGMLASFARHEPRAAAALASRGVGPVVRGRRAVALYYGFAPATPRPLPRGTAASRARRGAAPR